MTIEVYGGGQTSTADTSITISRGLSSPAAGDVYLCWMYSSDQEALLPSSVPSGWSLRAIYAYSFSIYLYYKVVTDPGSEPLNYTWTWNDSRARKGHITRYRYADADSPFDIAVDSYNYGSDDLPTGTSITTQTDNAVVLWLVMAFLGQTYTEPTGFTELLFIQGLETAYDFQESAGASGNKSGSIASNDEWIVVMTAIRPAVTAVEAPVCWGHSTGVTETIRAFAGNWTGTGSIGGSGDGEYVDLEAGETMESEIADTGTQQVTLLQNEYDTSGHDVVLYYRHAATEAGISSASWNLYSAPFTSLGFVQVRLALS